MKKWRDIRRKKSISVDSDSQIVETAAGEPIYEGISYITVHQGDTISADEKGNSFGITVVVFLVKIVDGLYWWYATEKEADEEPDNPCDSDFMREISS